MPLYRDSTTDAVAEYPVNIGNHPVLGRHLELYVPGEEYEEDKVIVENAVSTQRVQIIAKPTAPSSDTKEPANAK